MAKKVYIGISEEQTTDLLSTGLDCGLSGNYSKTTSPVWNDQYEEYAFSGDFSYTSNMNSTAFDGGTFYYIPDDNKKSYYCMYFNRHDNAYESFTKVEQVPIVKKVKKIYFGVNGIAKKVKKGYIGIGGVAKLFWNGGQFSSYGEITSLSSKMNNMAGTSLGNCALFGGGSRYISGGSPSSVPNTKIECYDNNLTKTIITDGVTTSDGITSGVEACNNGKYALFAGSQVGFISKNYICAYDESFTKNTNVTLQDEIESFGAQRNGNYACFLGGTKNGAFSGNLYAYDQSLVCTSIESIIQVRKNFGCANAGDYIIAYGGIKDYDSDDKPLVSKYIEAIDKNLTKVFSQSFTIGYYNVGGASCGDYALFAGGEDFAYEYGKEVIACSKSLTVQQLDDLPLERNYPVGGSLGDYAIFAGGRQDGISFGGYLSSIVLYDSSLTRIDFDTELIGGKISMAIANTKDYLLIAGGNGGDKSTTVSTVQAFALI